MRVRNVMLACLGLMIAVMSTVASAREGMAAQERLTICGAHNQCRAIADQHTNDALRAFFYGSDEPVTVKAPQSGKPEFRIVLGGRYVTGIVVLGRFLSYGVNLARFQKYMWYRLSEDITNQLAQVTRDLPPLHLNLCAVQLSNTGPTRPQLARCSNAR